MTVARNWDDFKRMLNVAFPKKGDNLEFDFVIARMKEAANRGGLIPSPATMPSDANGDRDRS